MSIFPDRKKWRHPSLAMSYRVQRWYAGYYPALLSRLSRARTPSFFFVREKERRGRKKKPWENHPAGGGPLATSQQPLCRCGLRPLIRKIETFSACGPAGTPASCRGSPFCFLPAPPRSCVTTRSEKSGDQLPRGCAAWGEEGDKGGRSAPAGLVGLGRRAHTGIRRKVAASENLSVLD